MAQNGQEQVSGVVLSEEEAYEHLNLEADLHERSGWTVTRGADVLICRRGNRERMLWIRKTNPHDDHVPE